MPIFRKKCMCLRAPKEEIDILDYSHCSLTDIPSDVFLHERTLVELLVDNNRIHDLPRQLFYCLSLRKLSLSENEVKEIPPVIGSLSNLEFLDISKNAIEKVPDNVDACKRLRVLEASVNALENIPEGLTRLVNLSELYLNDCFLESLPSSFGRLNQLKILELRENRLKTFPNSMSSMTLLERLDIGMNQFSELPDVLNSFFNLQELWFDDNSVAILPEEAQLWSEPCEKWLGFDHRSCGLGRLTKLSFIDASQNEIEQIAPEIEQCASLKDLDLSHNNLQTLPESFGRLSNMTNLRLDTNCLTALPFSIGGMVSLMELDVSVNNLEEIPIGIGLLRRLRTFRADDNFIMHIPSELGSCGALTILSLRSNSLTYIPDEIGHITHLHVLSLSDNKLTCLPFGLTKLMELKALWLADTQVKPLMHLQRDTDRRTGQKILTCYLLPQLSQKHYEDTSSFHSSSWEERSGRRRQIHFDFQDLPPEHTQLYRTPTPYPKELKQRIQRLRQLATKKSNGGETENCEAVTGRRMQRLSSTNLLSSNTQISTRPASPRLIGRHALLKADKEKTQKDKARMQMKGRREMRSEDTASSVSSVAVKFATKRTSDDQTEHGNKLWSSVNSVQHADSTRRLQQPESVGESNNNTLKKTYKDGRKNSGEGKQLASSGNPVRDQTTGYGSTSQLATDSSMNEVSGYSSMRRITCGNQNQIPRHSNTQRNAECGSVNEISGSVSGRCEACSTRGHCPTHLGHTTAEANTYRSMERAASCEDQLPSSPPLKGRRKCVDPTRPVTCIEGESVMFLKWHSPDEPRTGTLPNASSKAISSDNVNSASAGKPVVGSPPLKGRRKCVDPTRPVTCIEGESVMFLKWHSPDEPRTGTLPNASSKAISSDNVNSASAGKPVVGNGGIEMMSYGEFVSNMVATGRRFPSGSVQRDRRYPPPVYSYRYHPRQPSSSHGRRHGYDSDTGYHSTIGNHSHHGYDSDAGCRGDVGYRSDSECFRGNRFSSTNSANRKQLHPAASAFQESASTRERSVLPGSKDGRIKVPLERPTAHETIREEGETLAGRDAWRSYEARKTPDGRLQVVEERLNLAASDRRPRTSNSVEDLYGTKTKVGRKSRNMIPIEL